MACLVMHPCFKCLQDVDKVRQRVVEHMCSIALIKTVPASCKTQIIKFLAMHAYFAVDKSALGKVGHQSAPVILL